MLIEGLFNLIRKEPANQEISFDLSGSFLSLLLFDKTLSQPSIASHHPYCRLLPLAQINIIEAQVAEVISALRF